MKLSALDLRAFAAIVDLGGISAAARALGVPKSSVSRELASLEARFGMALLQRTTRRMSLTHAGEVLIAYARRVAEELDNAAIAVESLRDVPRGHLAVTAPYALLRHVLVPRLGVFRARFPDLRLSIDPTLRVLDLIDEGIDLALRFGPSPQSSLATQKLGDLPLILVASKDYIQAHGEPADPQDLGSHELIDMSPRAVDTEWRLIDEQGRPRSCAVSPRIAVADPSVVLDMAEQGLGIATAPAVLAAKAIQDGRLVRLLSAFTRGTRPFNAVYPARRVCPPKVQVFIDFVVECLQPPDPS